MRKFGVSMGQELARAGVNSAPTSGSFLCPLKGLLSPFEGQAYQLYCPGNLSFGALAFLTGAPCSSGHSGSLWLVPGGAWVPPWVSRQMGINVGP